MDNNLIPYQPVISDIKNLITVGRNVAYNAANRAMIMTYWNIGKRIVEEEQSGAERAEYGKRLIPVLSAELTKEFGNSYSSRNLHYYRKFYHCFPDSEILNTRVQNLNNGFQRSDHIHIFKLLHGLHLQFFCLFPWRCLFALLLFRGIQLCPDASFLFLGKEKAAGFL